MQNKSKPLQDELDDYPLPEVTKNKDRYDNNNLFDTVLRNSNNPLGFNQEDEIESLFLPENNQEIMEMPARKPKKQNKNNAFNTRRKRLRRYLRKKKDQRQDKIDEISYYESEWSQEIELQSSSQELIIPEKKKKKIKKKISSQRSTKNLLINFKNLFIKSIRKHINTEKDNYLNNFGKIKCLNLEQYAELLRKEEYQEILRKIFREKALERELLISRIDLKLKMVYLKKIKVFEMAFEKRYFPRIN